MKVLLNSIIDRSIPKRAILFDWQNFIVSSIMNDSFFFTAHDRLPRAATIKFALFPALRFKFTFCETKPPFDETKP